VGERGEEGLEGRKEEAGTPQEEKSTLAHHSDPFLSPARAPNERRDDPDYVHNDDVQCNRTWPTGQGEASGEVEMPDYSAI